MSYCRWSSMNWKCDLYCYYSVGDFYQTFVASRRRIGDAPEADIKLLLNNPTKEDCEEYARQHRVQMDWLDKAELEPIGGEYDGESFEDKTPQEFKQTLLMLREAGYIFPDYVLEEIDEEIKQTEK